MKRISVILLSFAFAATAMAYVPVQEQIPVSLHVSADTFMHRPPVEKRCFTSPAVEKQIREMHARLSSVSPKLWQMFCNCFPNTLDTTVFPDGDRTFVITGDIPCMWLRDSGAQVWTYMPYIKEDPKLRKLIRGVILQQLELICQDPYANAFMRDTLQVSPWAGDYALMKKGVHERKYELDSLCYPLRLAYQYWQLTGDDSIFGDLWNRAMGEILALLREQQRVSGTKTSYTFQRKGTFLHDTCSNFGYGHPTKNCGMVASAFRPSDDSQIFPFLVPSNFFAESVLRKAATILREVNKDDARADECLAIASDIRRGLEAHAVVEHPVYGRVYAFEVDGFGSHLLMDDGNAPSLLSLPYLCPELVSADDPVYQNTRRMIWSEGNPYYFSGTSDGTTVGGIGSPHTGLGYVWPMSIIMKGLTTTDREEQKECLRLLMETDGGTGFMHESFNPSNPRDFTRSWFAWANGLFGELVLRVYGSK
ncbi:MAG: glycoside hydrolase family 125 protein [Bacteroidaceae bacterium]|nr:glycoside hydrolase family 125 protein [Bacteroidaceae bacterium]